MSFREWLSYVESTVGSLVDVKGSFITPDNIYNRGSEENKRPFIYLGKDVVSGGKLYAGDAFDTHIELVGMKDELQDRRDNLGYDSSYDYRVDGIKHDLMGRMGDWTLTRSWLDAIDWDGLPPDIFLVSFWNKEKTLYDRNLVDCLRSMESYFTEYVELTGKEVFVSTPLLGTVHISKVMGGVSVGGTLSDEEKEKLDLHQRLHLMGPAEKKAAMAKLGLGGVKVSKRGEWEAGMRGLGMGGYMRQSEWIYR
jgi:hypothetical protein